MKIVPPTYEGLSEAAELLFDGEVVAYPTETVYGLAADPFSEEGLAKLFEIKGRNDGNPVLLIIDDEDDLFDVVSDVSERAEKFIEAFWPGPLSLLLPRVADLPKLVTAGQEKVCVRCPACEIARDLCQVYGGPLTSTSANRSGQPPARSLAEIDLPGVALAIDGGILEPSLPSTVYDPDEDRMVREGCITREQIRAILMRAE